MNYLKVPGAALTRGEREWLKSTAALTVKRFDNPTLFTVGVLWGASMWCLRAGAPDADLVGIDIDLRHSRAAGDRIFHEDELQATLIEADSTVYGTVWSTPIHFLFIDGDHHYEVATQDIAGWTPHVVPGGIVAFHDYNPKAIDLGFFPELEGLHRAIDEWQAEAQWERLQGVDSIAAFRRPF